MEKLKKTAAAAKRSTLSKNGVNKISTMPKSGVDANGAASKKPLLIHGGSRSKAVHVIAEKATAAEIRKALGIKRESTERIRKIIRELEEKNWQLD